MAFQEKNTLDVYEYQDLYEHFTNEHGLILLQSEMQEIIEICRKIDMKTEKDYPETIGFKTR